MSYNTERELNSQAPEAIHMHVIAKTPIANRENGTLNSPFFVPLSVPFDLEMSDIILEDTVSGIAATTHAKTGSIGPDWSGGDTHVRRLQEQITISDIRQRNFRAICDAIHDTIEISGHTPGFKKFEADIIVTYIHLHSRFPPKHWDLAKRTVIQILTEAIANGDDAGVAIRRVDWYLSDLDL